MTQMPHPQISFCPVMSCYHEKQVTILHVER